ncbi:hypothetical protein HELRODRAFT_188301 [Helobdella robusta]|uniref:Uncharacterized protein n=1 Tax=Helobdella robusta TaxID=6412 RepID=T1FPU6_HELRO|nr:hypothetical protein HELRODRAFT_188301 [Helobdella robusta]ESO06232.1 hypothetical protein HELRODRAFT_188301 [Helobdella robusta]
MAMSKRLDVSNSLPDDGDVMMKSTPCAAPSHEPCNPSRKLYPKEHSNWKFDMEKQHIAIIFHTFVSNCNGAFYGFSRQSIALHLSIDTRVVSNVCGSFAAEVDCVVSFGGTAQQQMVGLMVKTGSSRAELIKKHFLAVRFLANIAPKRDKYHLDFHRYAHTSIPNSSSINISRKNMTSRDVCLTGSTPCLQTIKKTED